ncbi:MAG: ribonuclease HII [Bacteroidota bacterium]
MRPHILLLSLFLFFACQKEATVSDNVLEQLPNDAGFFLNIHDVSSFLSETTNSNFINEAKGLPLIDAVKQSLPVLKLLQGENEVLVGYYSLTKDQTDFVLVCKDQDSLMDVSEQKDKTVETLQYEGHTITKYTFAGQELFSGSKRDYRFVSSSSMLLENILRAPTTYTHDKALVRLYNAPNSEKPATFLIHPEISKLTAKPYFKVPPKSIFSDWTSLDFTANQNQASFSGVAMLSDSVPQFLNLFQNTKALASKTPKYAPLEAQAILAYTFDDPSRFKENQNTFFDRLATKDTLFNTIEELGVIYFNNERIVVLESFGPAQLVEYFQQGTNSQGNNIFNVAEPDIINTAFAPLVQDFESNFATFIDNALILASKRESLLGLLRSYATGATYVQSPAYRLFSEQMANESSLLFLADKKGADFLAEDIFSEAYAKLWQGVDLNEHAFVGQVVMDNGFAHTNLLMGEGPAEQKKNTVSPVFSLELETDLIFDPVFVKNHRTNAYEIVVQDRDNVLYLISTDGKVLWKKALDGPVRGKIHQVDIYKNGKLQLAFCTSNRFLILDRNGEIVKPFDKTFEGGNLNALAVFDYENNKEYRFVITQGKKVFMYNRSFQIVDGFTFTDAPSAIVQAPQHFRLNNKDYLLFPLEDGMVKILHRVGRDRITINDKIKTSGNEWFLYKNKFSTTTAEGTLVQIDTKGKLSRTNFNLGQNHGIYATSKTLALMDDNVLSIRGKKVTLELGVYSLPKIFYINDKIYVSVTDIQNQKIYLFDSQAKPISGFPTIGSSLIDLMDMDLDKKLELVAKDQDNSIVVYKIN